VNEDERQFFTERLAGGQPDPAEYEFEPLEVSVGVGTQFILTFPWLNFDALVMHLYLREVLGSDYYLLPPKDPFLFGTDVPVTPPVERHPDGYYLASVSHLSNFSRSVQTIYGRFPARGFEVVKSKKTKIDTSRGRHKSAAIKFVTFPPQVVKFWLRGDLPWITKVLGGLTHLGKKGAAGFGAVSKVKVERASGDWSLVRDGKLTRPVPLRFLEHAERTMNVPWYPPYWAKGTAEPCGIPFFAGKLK